MLKGNRHNGLFLGIDGGGSKCKAIVMNAHNEVLGIGIAGPGNPLHGFEQATNSITLSAKLALQEAGIANIALRDLYVGVGLAGVNLPLLYKKMLAWQHPFKDMFLTTDLQIACLGAHQGEEGAVIITGTGSCGFSYVNGQAFTIGAHGFPHGDKGSGAWFGLQAVKQVLLSLDGLVAPSMMTDVLLDKLGAKNATALVEIIAGKMATYYAQLAKVVFDAADRGDELALAIVAEGAAYINSIASMLCAKNPPRISMIGGLASRLQPWLTQQLQQKLSAPLNPPEVGSVIFARKKLAQQ